MEYVASPAHGVEWIGVAAAFLEMFLLQAQVDYEHRKRRKYVDINSV